MPALFLSIFRFIRLLTSGHQAVAIDPADTILANDPNRTPDPSTLRRWAQHLDLSQPALSFLRQTLAHVTHWLAPGDPTNHQAGLLSLLTPVLQMLWPLRL